MKRFFQKGDSQTCRATYGFERRGRPRFVLHHVGKEGQANANDLAILSQPRDGLLQELLLVLGRIAADWIFAIGSSKSRQHAPRMIEMKQIDRRRVLPLDQRN